MDWSETRLGLGRPRTTSSSASASFLQRSSALCPVPCLKRWNLRRVLICMPDACMRHFSQGSASARVRLQRCVRASLSLAPFLSLPLTCDHAEGNARPQRGSPQTTFFFFIFTNQPSKSSVRVCVHHFLQNQVVCALLFAGNHQFQFQQCRSKSSIGKNPSTEKPTPDSVSDSGSDPAHTRSEPEPVPEPAQPQRHTGWADNHAFTPSGLIMKRYVDDLSERRRHQDDWTCLVLVGAIG